MDYIIYTIYCCSNITSSHLLNEHDSYHKRILHLILSSAFSVRCTEGSGSPTNRDLNMNFSKGLPDFWELQSSGKNFMINMFVFFITVKFLS